MAQVKIKLDVERETKNTIRYHEQETPQLVVPAVGTLYLSKGVIRQFFGGKTPGSIVVTIEGGE